MVSLQIMRILACFGVYNGHFLGHSINSEMAHEYLFNLRTNWVSDTVLSYFLWEIKMYKYFMF